MLVPLKIGPYKTKKLLGIGGYGQVVSAEHKITRNEFAIKLSSERKSLTKEYKFLKLLEKHPEFIKIHEYIRLENFDALVMELMKKDLQCLHSERSFTFECICAIGVRLLKLLEKVHSLDIIHRDIKPSQFIVSKDLKKIHLIDFGLAAYFRKDNIHKCFHTRNSCKGTTNYASINNHLGFTQSRRDDLESLCYSLIYFINGSLPWASAPDLKGLKKWNFILKKKVGVNEKSFGDIPIEIYALLKYSKSIAYEQTPNYSYMASLLEKFIDPQKLEMYYDWLSVDKPKLNRKIQIVEGATKITKLRREKKLEKQKINIEKFMNNEKKSRRIRKKKFKSIEILINKNIKVKNICIRKKYDNLPTSSPPKPIKNYSFSILANNVDSLLHTFSNQGCNNEMPMIRGLSNILELEMKKESHNILCVSSNDPCLLSPNQFNDTNNEVTSKVILPGFKDKKSILSKNIKTISEKDKINCLIS